MDYLHPAMVDALRGHWPLIEPGTPADEAQRVAADIEHSQRREEARTHRALQDQQQYLQGQGVLS